MVQELQVHQIELEMQNEELRHTHEELIKSHGERDRAGAALRASEMQMRMFIENAPTGFAIFDREMRYLAVSQRWIEDHRATGDLIGRTHYEVFPDLPERWRAVHLRGLAGEVITEEEDPFDRADGTKQWFKWEVRPWHTGTGEIGGIMIAAEEVTERKHAKDALRTSEERLRLAQDAAQMGSWDWDMRTGEILWSPLHETLFGYEPGTPRRTYADFQNRLHPEDVARVGAAVDEAIASQTDFHCEYRVVWPDASVHWISGFGRFHFDASGQPVRMLGMVDEISGRKRTEEALQEAHDELEHRVAERTAELLTANRKLSIEITERNQSEATLQMMRFCVDHAGDSIFWVNRAGRILYVNDAACAGRGYSREELLSMSIFDLDPDFQSGVWGPHFEDLKRRGTITLETRHRAKDGSVFPVEVNANYVQYDGEEFNFAFLRDITQRRLAEAQLHHQADELAARAWLLTGQNAEIEQARLALEEKVAELTLIGRYKSEFLANVSHELRTPLNPILIFSQQLAENKAANLSGKQVEFSQHIHSSATDLLHLISDILDLSKIESGTVSVRVEEIPFAMLHDSIDRNFRHVAEAKSLPFRVTFAHDLPQAMESDPQRLQQILKNLLSNAMKFTAHGSVEVRVGLATEGWSADHPVLAQAVQVVAFAVEDTGIGIAPEKQQLIFESFQQADAGTARNYGGTGLGLAISRDLTALLGGEIKLASTEEKGSIFTLYLPIHYAGADSTQIPPALLPPFAQVEHLDALEKTPEPLLPDSSGDLRGCKVLLVDDNPRNIFAMLSLLEDHEMEVLTAINGREAIEIIHRTPGLSIVLMDIMMPGMDGYATLREVRQLPQFHALPIIAVTAKAMPGDREKCLHAGASDYIAKPVNTTQLLALMRRWIFR